MNRRKLYAIVLFASIIIILLIILLSSQLLNPRHKPDYSGMVFKITMNSNKIALVVDRNKPVSEASRQLKNDLGLNYQKYSLILSVDCKFFLIKKIYIEF